MVHTYTLVRHVPAGPLLPRDKFRPLYNFYQVYTPKICGLKSDGAIRFLMFTKSTSKMLHIVLHLTNKILSKELGFLEVIIFSQKRASNFPHQIIPIFKSLLQA